MDGKKLVYTAKEEYMAVLIKDSLESEKIEVTILDQKDSASGIIGQFELFVRPDQYDQALAIIAANH